VVEVDEERTAELLRVLNSTPVVDGERRDLLAAETGPAAAFVREVRDALQAVVGGASPTTLEPLLDDVVRRPVVTAAGIDWTTSPPPDRAPGVDLLLAWDELERALPGRLRLCANPECTLYLLDRSRSGVGRWCSMATCGNRAKARRHYERTRSSGPGTT
jgi:predicted RNA-binding Zn ribbon-like protein